MVYTLAEEVIAWLGPADGSSDGGMAFLNACGEYASTTTELTPGLGRGPISSEECFAELTDLWDGVDEVLARPYWQRTWILQELLFAKKVLFRCGTESATYDDLCGFFTVMSRRADSPDIPKFVMKSAHLQSFSTIVSLRDLDGLNRTGLPLMSLLAEYQNQLVTDLRDKIYGLLGMASDASILVPRISYDMTVGDVYVNLTRSAIINSKHLDYVRFKSPFGQSSLDIPSWVIDLSTPCFDASTIESQSLLHYPMDWFKGPGACPTFINTRYGEGTLLMSGATYLGTVDGIGSILPMGNSFSDSRYDIIKPDTNTNVYRSEMATLEAIVETLTGTKPSPKGDQEFSTFEYECHKFNTWFLMKNSHLLTSLPELSDWWNKNKSLLLFGGRSLEE